MLAGHSATLWEGHIYIWGGKSDRGGGQTAMHTGSSGGVPELYNSHMYVLSPRECIDTEHARLKRLHVTSGGGEVRTGGGSSSTGAGPSIGASSTNSALSLPRGRAYHSAARYGRFLFITGGLTDQSLLSTSLDVEHYNSHVPVFDLERRSWSHRATFGDVPSARCHHVSVVYGDTLMVHGGYPILSNGRKELSAEEVAAMQHSMYDVHELHTITLKWTRIHTTQSPSLWGHSAIAYNDDVIVFGGVDVVENAETSSVAVWSTRRQRWVWVDSQSLELRCTMHTAVQDESRMLVYGGVSFRTKSKLRTLYEFNLNFGTWRELHPQGQIPKGRLGHAAVIFRQVLFIIGGSVKSDEGGGGGGGGDGANGGGDVFEPLVHLYHIPKNSWTQCELSVVDGIEGESNVSEALPRGEDGQGLGVTENNQKRGVGGEGRSRQWIPADDPSMLQHVPSPMRAADELGGMASTSTSIRDTIARARAIQSLTLGAANALEKSIAGRARVGGVEDRHDHYEDDRYHSMDGLGGQGSWRSNPGQQQIRAEGSLMGDSSAIGFGPDHEATLSGRGPPNPNAHRRRGVDDTLGGAANFDRHYSDRGAFPQQHHSVHTPLHGRSNAFRHSQPPDDPSDESRDNGGARSTGSMSYPPPPGAEAQGVNAQGTWKMIDYLRAENELLRRELEASRMGPGPTASGAGAGSGGALAGSLRNPYEVPIYNTHFTPTLPPNDRAAPLGVESLRSLTEIVVPRLNLNVADPPRSLGSDRSGHMSREAVTALINSSIKKDLPASLSLASRLARQSGGGADGVGLDPMAYLHVTPNVARANASHIAGQTHHTGPLTYDQLLAKTAGGGYAHHQRGGYDGDGGGGGGGASAVPRTLQPLLSLLASSTTGAAAPDYSPVSGSAYVSQGGVADGRSRAIPPSNTPPSTSMGSFGGGERKSQTATPTLGGLVSGKGSMLSLETLRGGGGGYSRVQN